jgi:hypothetical protein
MKFTKDQLKMMYSYTGEDFERFLDLLEFMDGLGVDPKYPRKRRSDRGKPRNGTLPLEAAAQ